MTGHEPLVVVGYDESPQGHAVVERAALEAERRGAVLEVVYALDYTMLVGGPDGTAPWLPALAAEAAQRHADEGAGIARRRIPGLAVRTRTPGGPPVPVLVRASHEADLLVLGSRRRGEVAAVVRGSTSVAVAAHAQCPVLVVAGDPDALPRPGRPVVVGVDGSGTSDAAVGFAAREAQAAGAPLVLVCAFQPPVRDEWARVYWSAVDPTSDPLTSMHRAAEGVARRAQEVAAAVAPGVATTVRVMEARPAAAITSAVRDPGLIVVGARGRGAFAGLVLGSVSHDVLHRAPCSVAVVRPVTDGGPAPAARAVAHAEG